ncbi:MAG: hypothetical protein ACLTLQ_16390 [[Clostridium] scindens]
MKRLEYYGAGNMEQEIKRIQFLTDQGCQSFFDQITAYMEHKYGIDSVKDVLGMTAVWARRGRIKEQSMQRRNGETPKRLGRILYGLKHDNELL